MKNAKCCHCARELVKINGRTLKAAIDILKSAFEQKFNPTEWVSVCPVCHCYTLGIDTTTPSPFLCGDGVMRVTTDFDHNEQLPSGEVLSFAGFKFTRAAFNASVTATGIIDQTTKKVEQIGTDFLRSPSDEKAYEFSRRVCEWGRGQRVWGNLNRFHSPEELGAKIRAWLIEAHELPPGEAIVMGAAIKGLRVSFASKHLRLLCPSKFGVLDEVISEGFGLALNEAGYRLFHELLANFQQAHAADKTIAEIESGLFLIVRQVVRAVV